LEVWLEVYGFGTRLVVRIFRVQLEDRVVSAFRVWGLGFIWV